MLWPAANAHPVRKSCHTCRPDLPSAPRPKSLPASSPSPLPALRPRAANMHPPPASAAPCDPPSRSPSAASSPFAHTPPAPCTPALSPLNVPVTVPRIRPLLPLCSCNTPPTASHPPSLPAQLPPPRAPLHTPLTAPRSPLTRSGIPESLPENRSAPQTRCSHPPTTAPDPPSGTSAHPLRQQTDPSEIVPPSTPLDSSTRALLPPRQCTTPPSPPPAPVPHARPECISACSRSAGRSEHSTSRPVGRELRTLWQRS